MATMEKVRGKYPCPFNRCSRHDHPFDSEAQLRGHLSWHARKRLGKQGHPSSGESKQNILLEAFREAPNHELTTAGLIDVLRSKGFKQNSDCLRTFIGSAARNPRNQIKRVERGLYRWIGKNEPSSQSPDKEQENPEMLRQELYRARNKAQRLQELLMQAIQLAVD